ncbi:hypothetical protein J6590_077095 [Homalodisca vitripennis]|nr:hypothetical protein J6590_077095 [Homalodisca vitripennis]
MCCVANWVLRDARINVESISIVHRNCCRPVTNISDCVVRLLPKSELEIAQVRILSVTVALFISTINLVLYRHSSSFCLIRSSHRPVAHEDGQNKA